MATITDTELVSLPPQRPQALVMFNDRHNNYTARCPASAIGDLITKRWLARTWIALTRRQEQLTRRTTT